MRKLSVWGVLPLLVIGCGGRHVTTGEWYSATRTTGESAAGEESATAIPDNPFEDALAVSAAELASLPTAPWAEEPIAPAGVAAMVVRAWQDAENKTECAPVAPRALGAGDGARARRTSLDGGWAVEFDRAGAPGLRRDGRPCESCGRGAFGIAGTAMTPDETVDVDTLRAPEPMFNDGSRADLTMASASSDASAATITISGQNCVYQVWSFLGQEHLQQLVDELRFVDVEQTDRRVAELSE